jgi:hypothetical protein
MSMCASSVESPGRKLDHMSTQGLPTAQDQPVILKVGKMGPVLATSTPCLSCQGFKEHKSTTTLTLPL